MNQVKQIALALAATGALSMLPLQSHALVKWSMSSGCGTSSYGNTCTYNGIDNSNGDVVGNVDANAWANTGNNATLETAAVLQWSGGIGVGNQAEGTNPGSPNHSMDNYGSLDLVIFDFGPDLVTLSQVALGWYENDSDISVLAWTGAGMPDVDGKLYSESTQDLTTNGWTLIGNYDVDHTDNTNPYRQSIDTTVSSSYWLVGAYNPAFGECSAGAGNCNLSPYNDYVKILELKGSIDQPPPPPPPGVPAPGTLLLLTGVLPFVRRRRVATATA